MDCLKKILIVGNDQRLHNRIKSILSEKKCRISYTSQINDGLKSIIDKTNPELIIVDPEISRLKGIEISLLVRRWTPVPILILTTAQTMEHEVRALDLKAEDCLSEPIDISLVAERINNILSLSPTS
jgi:two-component system, OmpR family, response regulator MprA